MSTTNEIQPDQIPLHALADTREARERLADHAELRSASSRVKDAFESVAVEGGSASSGAQEAASGSATTKVKHLASPAAALPMAAREPCLRALEEYARALSASFRRESEIDSLGKAVSLAPHLDARAHLLRREHQAFKWELARIRAEAIAVRGMPGWLQLAGRFERLTRRLASHEREENEIIASAMLDDIGAGD